MLILAILLLCNGAYGYSGSCPVSTVETPPLPVNTRDLETCISYENCYYHHPTQSCWFLETADCWTQGNCSSHDEPIDSALSLTFEIEASCKPNTVFPTCQLAGYRFSVGENRCCQDVDSSGSDKVLVTSTCDYLQPMYKAVTDLVVFDNWPVVTSPNLDILTTEDCALLADSTTASIWLDFICHTVPLPLQKPLLVTGCDTTPTGYAFYGPAPLDSEVCIVQEGVQYGCQFTDVEDLGYGDCPFLGFHNYDQSSGCCVAFDFVHSTTTGTIYSSATWTVPLVSNEETTTTATTTTTTTTTEPTTTTATTTTTTETTTTTATTTTTTDPITTTTTTTATTEPTTTTTTTTTTTEPATTTVTTTTQPTTTTELTTTTSTTTTTTTPDTTTTSTITTTTTTTTETPTTTTSTTLATETISLLPNETFTGQSEFQTIVQATKVLANFMRGPPINGPSYNLSNILVPVKRHSNLLYGPVASALPSTGLLALASAKPELSWGMLGSFDYTRQTGILFSDLSACQNCSGNTQFVPYVYEKHDFVRNKTIQYFPDSTGIFFEEFDLRQQIPLENGVKLPVRHFACNDLGDCLLSTIPNPGAGDYFWNVNSTGHTNPFSVDGVLYTYFWSAYEYPVNFSGDSIISSVNSAGCGFYALLRQFHGTADECISAPGGFKINGRCFYASPYSSTNTLYTVTVTNWIPLSKDNSTRSTGNMLGFSQYGPHFASTATLTYYVSALPFDSTIFQNSTGLFLEIEHPQEFNFIINYANQPLFIKNITAVGKVYPIRTKTNNRASLAVPNYTSKKASIRYQQCTPRVSNSFFAKAEMYGCTRTNFGLVIGVPIASAWLLLWFVLFFVRLCQYKSRPQIQNKKRKLTVMFFAPFIVPFTMIYDFLVDAISLCLLPLLALFTLGRKLWLANMCRRKQVSGRFRVNWLLMFVPLTGCLLSYTAAQYVGTTRTIRSAYGTTIDQTGTTIRSQFDETYNIPLLTSFELSYSLFDESKQPAGSLSITVVDVSHKCTATHLYYGFAYDVLANTLNQNWDTCSPCDNDDTVKCWSQASYDGKDDCDAKHVYSLQHMPHAWRDSQTGAFGNEWAFCVVTPLSTGTFVDVYQVSYLTTSVDFKIVQRDESEKVIEEATLTLGLYENTWTNHDESIQITIDLSNLPPLSLSTNLGILKNSFTQNLGMLAELPPYSTISQFQKTGSFPSPNKYGIGLYGYGVGAYPSAGTLSCDWARAPFSFEHLSADFPSFESFSGCTSVTDCIAEPKTTASFLGPADESCTSESGHCVAYNRVKPDPCTVTLKNCVGNTASFKARFIGYSSAEEDVSTLTATDLSASISGYWAKDSGVNITFTSKKAGFVRFSHKSSILPNLVGTVFTVGTAQLSATAFVKDANSITLTDDTVITATGSLDDPPEFDGEGDDGHHDDNTGVDGPKWDGFGFGQFASTLVMLIVIVVVFVLAFYCCCRLPMPSPIRDTQYH
jgi:hypothetical protein